MKGDLPCVFYGFDPVDLGWVLLNAGVSSLTEGGEEIASEALGIMTDALILGDLSGTEQAVEKYMRDGMTRAEAQERALLDNISALAMAGIGGLLSGFLLGNITGALGQLQLRQEAEAFADRVLTLPQDRQAYQLFTNAAGVTTSDPYRIAKQKLTTYALELYRKAYKEGKLTPEQGITDGQKTVGTTIAAQANNQAQTMAIMEQAQNDEQNPAVGHDDPGAPQGGTVSSAVQFQSGDQTSAIGQMQSSSQIQTSEQASTHKPGAQYYIEAGGFGKKAAQAAGAVLDKILDGKATWQTLTNSDIDKLKITTPQGAKTVSVALGVTVTKALTATDARSIIRSAVMQLQRPVNIIAQGYGNAIRNTSTLNHSAALEYHQKNDIINTNTSYAILSEDEKHLIEELESNNVKFSKKDIVFITRDQTGQIVWLEKGNTVAGLDHIIKRHVEDFKAKHNIAKSEVSKHLKNVISSGVVVYSRVDERKGRKCFERLYSYNEEIYVLVGIGLNGFVVSGYPIDEAEALKREEKYKNEEKNKDNVGLFSGADLAE